MIRRGTLGCFVAGILFFGRAVFGEPPTPVIPCPRVEKAPVIDGVREQTWNQATFLGGFLRTDGKSGLKDQTFVSLMTDGEKVYVFLEAQVKDGQLVAVGKKRDDEVYLGEDLEVFVSASRKPDEYVQFAINPDGCIYDASKRDASWNFDWKAVVKRTQHAWRVEMAIPPECLGLKKFPDHLYVNFCRTRCRSKNKNGRVFSCYAPTYEDFHRPDRFAELRFSGFFVQEDRGCTRGAVGTLRAKWTIGLAARGGQRVLPRVVVATRDGELANEQSVFVLHGSPKTVNMTFAAPSSGRVDIWREVLTQSKKDVVYRSSALRIVVPDVLSELSKARALLSVQINAMKRYEGEHPDLARSVLADLTRLDKKLADEQRRALRAAPQGQVGLIRSIDRELADRWPDVYRLIAKARFLAGSDLADYAVGATHSLVKVQRNDFARLAASSSRVGLSACKNERESFQVMVAAFSHDLENVKIRCGDLRNGDAVIDASNVAFSLVGYVKSRGPKGEAYWPDPLLPVKNVRCAGGHIVTFWGTVYVPKSARAGDYSGTITIEPANAPACSMPLRLHVFDFAIPTRSHFRTAFWIFRHTIRNFYGLQKVPFDLYARFLDLCLKNRLSPIDAAEWHKNPFLKVVRTKEGKWRFDFTDVDRYLAFCMKRGMNAFNIGDDHWFYTFFYRFHVLDEATGQVREYRFAPGSKEENEILRAFLEQCRQHLKAKGWIQFAYLQAYDEPNPRVQKQVKAYYDRVHETWPDLKTLITSPPQPSMMGAVRIWVPLTPSYRLRVAEERRRHGEEVWWYVCCGPREPYANFFLQQPSTAHRMLFWQSWKYKSQGLLYWGVNHWPAFCAARMSPVPPERRWPNVEWNDGNRRGDGYLIYPGPDGPLSSIRLEVIRDGMEDYEYFYLLRELLEKRGIKEGKLADLLVLDEPWIKSLREYTNKPELIQLRREQVAREIEKLVHGNKR